MPGLGLKPPGDRPGAGMRPEPAFLRGAHQRGFVSGASRVPTGSGRARRRRAGAEDQTRAARLPHPAALALLPEASPGSGPRPGHRASKPRRQRPCPGFQALGPSERGAAWKPQRSAPPTPTPGGLQLPGRWERPGGGPAGRDLRAAPGGDAGARGGPGPAARGAPFPPGAAGSSLQTDPPSSPRWAPPSYRSHTLLAAVRRG